MWSKRVTQVTSFNDDTFWVFIFFTNIGITNYLYLNDDKNLPIYSWTYRCAYSFSKEACAYTAEQLTHKYLKEYLDKSAPIGEVFNCSLRLAVDVVERVIEEKGWEEYVTKLDGW